jgi:hypothetical protein
LIPVPIPEPENALDLSHFSVVNADDTNTNLTKHGKLLLVLNMGRKSMHVDQLHAL